MLTPREVVTVSAVSIGLFAAFAFALSIIPLPDRLKIATSPPAQRPIVSLISLPPRIDTSPLVADYAEIKSDFDAHIFGPLVNHQSIDGYGERMANEKSALLIAPGVELADPRDRAAVKTVLLDVEFTDNSGNNAIARPPVDPKAWENFSPEEKLARRAPAYWRVEPFQRGGHPVRATIKNVPIRVLFGDKSVGGRIAFKSKACRKLTLVRVRAQASQGFAGPVPMAYHRAEFTSDGTLTYEGSVGVIIPGKHVDAAPAAEVRRTINTLLGANLLQLIVEGQWEGGGGNPWSAIGSVQVTCDGRTLLSVPVTLTRSKGVTLDEQIASLGVDRYTTGTDETVPLLAAKGWDFTVADREHIKVIRQLAKSLSPDGMRNLVRRGAPLTAAQQVARNGRLPIADVVAEPAPILKIVAARGRGDIVRALLQERLAWSRIELSAALVAFAKFDDLATFKALLAAGADVNARNEYDYSTLSQCPRPDVAKLLLDAGADLVASNAQGVTVRELLRKNLACTATSQVVEKWALAHERPH